MNSGNMNMKVKEVVENLDNLLLSNQKRVYITCAVVSVLSLLTIIICSYSVL